MTNGSDMMTGNSGTAISRLAERIAGRLPLDMRSLLAEYPFVRLCLRYATLLIVFLAFEAIVMRSARLPDAAYEQPFLIVELIRRFGPLISVCLAIAVVVMVRYGKLMLAWSELENGRLLRLFIVFLALVMAWPLSTYGYNYYLDQGHNLDRALIVFLAALLWLRPAFVFPFLFMAFTLLWQLGVPPLAGTIFAHKLQVLHVLNMFGAFLALRAVSGTRRSSDFVFMACCLVAAAYWLPALAKLRLNWLADPNLHLLPLAAYAHGWLGFLEPATIVRFSQWVAPFDLPLAIFVLVAEGLCLTFLLHRKLSIGLLVAVIVFHTGVFIYYGFCFWTWVALDAALLVLLLNDLSARRIPIYDRNHLVISVLLIGLGAFWARPPELGWHDTRLTYTYRIDAVGADARRFTLSPRFFSPYEDVFTLMSFSFLVEDHPVLTAPYGVTKDQARARAVNDANTAADVFRLEARIDDVPFNAGRAGDFYALIQRFTSNWNARGRKMSWLEHIKAPRQFWDFSGERPHRANGEIHELIVTEITMFFDGSQLRPIREAELGRLTVPAGHGS